MLGYPDTALKEAEDALTDARAIGHATTLIFTLALVNTTHMLSGNFVAANDDRHELAALAEKTGSFFWKTVALAIEARDLVDRI
jgi:predicted ATPase